MGHWITADSEAIAGFSYDAKKHVLRVRFMSGGTYDYLQAKPSLYRRLLAAPSKGQFFSRHIRDRLVFRKVK